MWTIHVLDPKRDIIVSIILARRQNGPHLLLSILKFLFGEPQVREFSNLPVGGASGQVVLVPPCRGSLRSDSSLMSDSSLTSL